MTSRTDLNSLDNIPEIPVVILCGGKGNMLREETEFGPKSITGLLYEPS